MPNINDLYEEISNLNTQIEEWSNNSSRQQFKIKFKIDELKIKKEDARSHLDFLSEKKFQSEIDKLEKDLNGDIVLNYKLQIDNCKKQIVEIIFEYYKNGITIEDIITLENIPPEISKNWLNFSNFGDNTGYLFIDEINEDELNWVYSNPINEVRFKSNTLENLKKLIIDNGNEVFYIFNNDLADKSNKKDLAVCQESIDLKLNTLESSISDYYSIFNYFVNNADKFSNDQLYHLTEIMINHPNLNFLDDFNNILKINKSKIDESFYYKAIYEIINSKITKFEKSNSEEIIHELKEFADKFSENQINDLCKIIIDKEDIFPYNESFVYILNCNEDEFDINKFYNDFIDKHIEKLKNNIYSEIEEQNLFKDLELYADKFSENQLVELSDLILDKSYVSYYYDILYDILYSNECKLDMEFTKKIYEKIINHLIDNLNDTNLDYYDLNDLFTDLNRYKNKFTQNQIQKLCDWIFGGNNIFNYFEKFDQILNANENDLEGIDFDEIYNKIIESGIDRLKESNLGCDEVTAIFKCLYYYSDRFSSNQLIDLCNAVFNNNLYCFATNFKKILNKNIDKINLNYSEISDKIIDSRINILNNSDLDKINPSRIIHDLREFSSDFNSCQLTELCNIIINNSEICNFAHDFNYIVKNNENKLENFSKNEIFSQIIDSKIEKLNNTDPKVSIPNILKDLNVYSEYFNKNQIKMLCKIIIDDDLILKYDSIDLNFILCCQDKFDDDMEDEISRIIIDAKINELDKLIFGYTTAKKILIFLTDYLDKFTDEQIVRLCNVSNSNFQVYNCNICSEVLEKILIKFKERIDDDLYNETIVKNNIHID